MAKYVQTNQNGYVVGIVEEPLLVGLFGGTRTLRVTDQDAENIGGLLETMHLRGEGLHIDDVVHFDHQKI